MIAKYNETEGGLSRRLAAARLERNRGRAPPARRDGTHPPDAAERHRDAARLRRHGVHAGRAEGDHQDAVRDDPDRRPGRVPVHGIDPHGARAAGGDAGVAGRRGHRHARVRIQPESADHARDRAVGRTGRRRRDRRRGERGAARARGQIAHRGGAARRARAARARSSR